MNCMGVLARSCYGINEQLWLAYIDGFRTLTPFTLASPVHGLNRGVRRTSLLYPPNELSVPPSETICVLLDDKFRTFRGSEHRSHKLSRLLHDSKVPIDGPVPPR